MVHISGPPIRKIGRVDATTAGAKSLEGKPPAEHEVDPGNSDKMGTPIAQENSFRRIRLSDRDGARPAAPLGNAIFYTLLTLIALVAIPYGTVEPWWQALFECVIFVLAALSLIELFLSGSWNFSSLRILLSLAALALFGLLQTVSFGGASSLKAGVRGSQALGG